MYPVKFASCFEPYVVVEKSVVPMYDERFRGYGMNKASTVYRNVLCWHRPFETVTLTETLSGTGCVRSLRRRHCP